MDVLGLHKGIDTMYRGVKHTYVLTRAEQNNYIHAADGVTNSANRCSIFYSTYQYLDA